MNHPVKYFKPSCGWINWEIPEKQPTIIYEIDNYDYHCEKFYVVGRYFNKKDAYKRIIKMKYDWWQEWQNERLLYGKNTFPDIEENYRINKVEVI